MGFELFVYDGYRPLEVQNYFYFDWYPKYLAKLYPNHNEQWIQNQVDRYWSKGAHTDLELEKNPPTHSTGAAVDLTIKHTESRRRLEMGSVFDDLWEVSHLDYYEEQFHKRDIGITEREALRNRRFLYHTMKDHGFCENPYEWWHYSYGDKAWAIAEGKSKALYPYIEL